MTSMTLLRALGAAPAAAQAAHAPVPTTPAGKARVVDSDFARELLAGLSRRPRSISPKFFYDAEGSALFDRICELPEYYPTRTELALLQTHAEELAGCIGDGADIVEFGAGSSRKIRVLLDALPGARRFVPIDISGEHLEAAAAQLRQDYPELIVQPVAADFTRPIQLPPMPAWDPAAARQPARRVGFFPGSSIGNFTPDDALRFLRHAAEVLQGGSLLVGVDLVKDPAVLHAAYNDAAGVTAAFNLNLLHRANRELGADFDVDAFSHYAFYQPSLQRIEMHLVSRTDQTVRVCGHEFEFAEGDDLHTENSHKHTLASFRALAARAGWRPRQAWCDPQRLFSLHWLDMPR